MLIDNTREEQAAPKEVEGFWFMDGDEIDENDSTSFIARKKLFINSDSTFTKSARLCGFIYHDLVKILLFDNKQTYF